MPKKSRAAKKRSQRGSHGEYHGLISHENDQETQLYSLTNDTSASSDKELDAQLVTIIMNFKAELKCEKSNRIIAHGIEKSDSSENTDIVQENVIDSMQLVSTSQTSPNFRRMEANNMEHNHTVQENESKVERKEKDRTMIASIMTDVLEDSTLNADNTDVTAYKNEAECTSEKTDYKTILNCKTESKCKIKLKSEATKLLHLSQSQEESSLTNQIDTHESKVQKEIMERTTKETRKDKKKAHTIENKPIEKNVQESYCSNSNKIIRNNIVKETKNAQETRQSLEMKNAFLDHVPIEEMKEILKNQTSDNKQYVEGNIRVNSKYSNYAYLSMGDGERDLLINGVTDRNRAFDGDLVVARINPQEDWHVFSNGQTQKTGVVICILKKVHSRRVIGHLVQHVKRQKPFIVIKPRDQRVPLIRIYTDLLPYHTQIHHYENAILIVNIECWPQPNYALGEILWIVGEIGNITSELEAIILENGLDVSPYQQELLQGLPNSDYLLTNDDIKNREDWRHECIFTIDPATASDLDDAISCKVLDNGNYEIGVHIADVTHYLEFFSPLDNEIAKRTTTIYLPHMVYHMLPEQLGQVCSLMPGKDKLTFSVIWEMTPNAEIIKHRFAKTIIKSCCKMSYDAAQIIIDNREMTSSTNILEIEGNHTASSLSNTINNLFKLSVILRDRRFTNGALRLDQPKIQMRIDPTIMREHGIPIPVSYYLEKRNDSTGLIEEFMLLANMTVAEHLYSAIPETALLRIHKKPSEYNLTMTCNTLRSYGIHLNCETAGSLHTSIQCYERSIECNSSTVNNSMKYIMMVIANLCSKTMARAEYKCVSTVPLFQNLRHYALNASVYTHFTSPMRRYSDCIVHRLLYATIEKKPLPKEWTANFCSMIANNCNIKKYSAKVVQEQANKLLFTYMVGLTGGFNALAIVLDVKERYMDIILSDTGIKLRINFKDIKNTTATVEYSTDFAVPTITVYWKTPSVIQKINMFSLVSVRVENKDCCLKAFLQPDNKNF